MATAQARRVPVHDDGGTVIFLDLADVFYLQVDGDDTLIRARRRCP